MAEPESPLASGAHGRHLATIPVPPLLAEWQALFGIDVADELRGIEALELWQCPESGLQFFLPETAVGSPALYEQLARFDWFYMPEKWEFREALRDLGSAGRLLEIGCGPGHFLALAGAPAGNRRVTGLELTPSLRDAARARGLDARGETAAALAACGERFDAVCAFQVLEHVPDPAAFLEEALSVLAPGGLLVLSVPNRESFLRHQRNLLDMPPHHMTRWSPATFRWLADRLPLRLRRIALEPLAEYHVNGYVFAHGLRARAALGRAGRFLPDRALHGTAALLRASRAYRLLRGQTLYGVFVRR